MKRALAALLVYVFTSLQSLAQDSNDFGNSANGLDSATPDDSSDNFGIVNSQSQESDASGDEGNAGSQNQATEQEGSDANSGFQDSNNGSGSSETDDENPSNAVVEQNNPVPEDAAPINDAEEVPTEVLDSLNNTGSTPVNEGAAVNPNAQALLDEISKEASPVNPAVVVPGSEQQVPQAKKVEQTEVKVDIEDDLGLQANEFAGAPPLPGTARAMADGEAPEEYFVQPGDTLFDICDQLLDEPGYWPKLWSLNPEIKNPHFIFPNMRLRFYPGDDETPPYLQVVTEEDVIPIDKGNLEEKELVSQDENFESEASEVNSSEALIEVVGADGVDTSGDEIISGGQIYNNESLTVYVPGFIFREQKEPLGVIVGGAGGELAGGPGRKLLVEPKKGVETGTLYTVLRQGELISDPRTGDFVGYKYYFVANLRISKRLEGPMFVGAVQDTRLGVFADDIVVEYISTLRTIPGRFSGGSLSNVDSNVVGFQFSKQEIGGFGNYAFIDKGNNEGVSAGMYLPIYATPGYLSLSTGKSKLPVDYEVIGFIRVIDTTEVGAVGYIVQSMKEFRIGDRTSSS